MNSTRISRLEDALTSVAAESHAASGAGSSLGPRFLAAVPEALRPRVETALQSLHRGIYALFVHAHFDRPWATAGFPAVIIEALLSKADAAPEHNCRDCGLSIPIIAPSGWPMWAEATILFPACPACGGETGFLLYPDPVMDAFRALPIDRQIKICTRQSERDYFHQAIAEGREPC